MANQLWRGRTEDKKANPAPPIDTWETWLRHNQTLKGAKCDAHGPEGKWINSFTKKKIPLEKLSQNNVNLSKLFDYKHKLKTPSEKIAFTVWPKIHSHSQIFRYGRSIFCLPHRPNFSDIFDLCLHWVSVVRELIQTIVIFIFLPVVWLSWNFMGFHEIVSWPNFQWRFWLE